MADSSFSDQSVFDASELNFNHNPLFLEPFGACAPGCHDPYLGGPMAQLGSGGAFTLKGQVGSGAVSPPQVACVDEYVNMS